MMRTVYASSTRRRPLITSRLLHPIIRPPIKILHRQVETPLRIPRQRIARRHPRHLPKRPGPTHTHRLKPENKPDHDFIFTTMKLLDETHDLLTSSLDSLKLIHQPTPRRARS